jgi:phage-related protein
MVHRAVEPLVAVQAVQVKLTVHLEKWAIDLNRQKIYRAARDIKNIVQVNGAFKLLTT